MFPKDKPLRDRKYLDSYRDAACYACGAHDGTVVGAHIRHGHGGGIGLKPDDFYVMPLCYACHAEQGQSEAAFWSRVDGVGSVEAAKIIAKGMYEKWRKQQEMGKR